MVNTGKFDLWNAIEKIAFGFNNVSIVSNGIIENTKDPFTKNSEFPFRGH